MTAPKKPPAKKPAKKRAARAPKPAAVQDPALIAQFPAWYRKIEFSSGDRAMSILTLGVENMHDEALVPLLPHKDMMLEITVRAVGGEA